MTREALIEVEHVSVAYGDRVALEDVSLTLHAGEVIAFVGPNGAGKSTLLKTIAGHVRPDIGTVTFAPALGPHPRQAVHHVAVHQRAQPRAGRARVLDPDQQVARAPQLRQAGTDDGRDVVEALPEAFQLFVLLRHDSSALAIWSSFNAVRVPRSASRRRVARSMSWLDRQYASKRCRCGSMLARV